MTTSSPRLVIAGLSGDSGKTIASLSILVALKERGFSVSVFKKGPDYIDPAWLSLLSGTACRSLDTYLVDAEIVRDSFLRHAAGSDISLIEGNRGIFDGKDINGTHSTAQLAKLLRAPVVLVVGAAKSTRTVAALVKGCVDFDPDLDIAGVILNRVANPRHLRILTESIVAYCGVPVLGAIPRLGEDSSLIPGRHLGLVTPAEHEGNAALRARLRELASHLEIDRIVEVARSARPVGRRALPRRRRERVRARIGCFRDAVFTFYYPENLEALEAAGAQLVPVSSLADRCLPELDALYIGGGFPETHVERLLRNRSMMKSVAEEASRGLPVYAECGGLIYLARSLKCGDVVYPMAGVLPIDLAMHPKPVGHGYTCMEVDAANPFFEVGTTFRGHEFHYSGLSGAPGELASCLRVGSGVGVGGARDGLVRAGTNVLACYTHIHADGVESWASAMVSRAAEHADRRGRSGTGRNEENGWRRSEAI